MTKEEQLGKYPIVANNDGTRLFVERNFALKAMDEYAKLKCIQFAQWLNDTNWGEKQTWGRHDPPSHPTNEQLYEIFLQETDNQLTEQQNKDNDKATI